MKVHHTRTSFLARLMILIVLEVSCRASKWALKPGQNLDSILENYEKVVLDRIDETQINLYTEETLVASKDGKTLMPIHLEIPAFGRTLFLHLRWGQTAFTPDAKVVVHGRTPSETVVKNATDLHTGYVEGFLVNDTRSIVRGLVLYGAFLGLVSSSMDGNFYVEPASHYFLDASPLDVIVYRDRDVRTFGNGSKRFEDNVEGDKVLRDGPNISSNTFTSNSSKILKVGSNNPKRHRDDSDKKFRGILYTGSKKFGSGLNCRKFCKDRTLSQAAKGIHVKKVCKLVVVADHLFYIRKGAKDLKTTVALMQMYVNLVDKMFRDTDFSGLGTFDDIHIQITRVEVYRTAHDDNYHMSDTSLSPKEYLLAFSRYTYFENYCAALAFSYRFSIAPELGYSFMSEDDNRRKGICAPVCCEGTDKQSKNTAWVSFNNNGKDMPVARAAINVAHQMGHLFGSLEDQFYDDPTCSDESFIMDSKINDGISQQNRWFSFCSIRTMREKIKTEGRCLNQYQCSDCTDDDRTRANDSYESRASLMGLVGFRILQFWILVVGRHFQLIW